LLVFARGALLGFEGGLVTIDEQLALLLML